MVYQSTGRFYGKCFSDLQLLRAEIKELTLKSRYRNFFSGKMKNPFMLNVLHQINRVSQRYKSLKEAYCEFVETFFNLNPSQANESYENGLDYIDNDNVKTLYMLESFFEVNLNIFEVKAQTEHGKKHTSLMKKVKTNQKHLYTMKWPANPCKKKLCYFFITRYSSTQTHDESKTISIMLSHLKKTIKNPVSTCLIIKNIFCFKRKFEPLIGMANDKLVLEKSAVLNNCLLQQLGLDSTPHIKVEDMFCVSTNIKPTCNVVILRPISFSCTYNVNRRTVNNLYYLANVIQTDCDYTQVLLIDKVSVNEFNIFESCLVDIDKMYYLGTTKTITRLSELKGLSTKRTTEKKLTDFTKCPCEHFGTKDTDIEYNFKTQSQRPLRLNKKCLPIHLSTLDLFNVSDFRRRISLASKISHTFFDIESLQHGVFKETSKNPGVYLKLSDMVNTISGYHKIIMIGYSDMISTEIKEWHKKDNTDLSVLEGLLSKKGENIEIFHLQGNDKPSNITEPNFINQTQLVKDFFEFVYMRSALIKEIKYCILSPILNYLGALTRLEQRLIGGLNNENDNHRTEIDRILNSMDIFLNESLLWGFNSAKYDNVIIMPYLKYLLDNNKDSLFYYRNIRIFRRGRHITDLSITKNNIKIKCRDFLHIENPYTSLEDMAKKYSIKHSKAVFPHKLSESIKKLKSANCVPMNDKYWVLLNGSHTPYDKREQASQAFISAKVSNMYEYMVFYLRLDVLCLQECLFAYQSLLHETEGWDIAANKMLTISTLMYEINYKQEFINDPFKLSVFEIKDPFVKHVLEMSIMGGITICMFSGTVGKNPRSHTYPVSINSHLRYSDVKHVGPKWPGLYILRNELEDKQPQKAIHNDTPLIESPLEAKFIHSYDMLSLYASAMYHDIPVGPCRQWHFGHKDELSNFHPNCSSLETYKFNPKDQFFRETVSTDKQEQRFISEYLNSFNFREYKDVCVRSQFHVGGNVCFEYKSYPDLFIKGRRRDNNILSYFIVNFDGCYYHGHHNTWCPLSNNKIDLQESENKIISDKKHERRKAFFQQLLSYRPIEEQVIVKYEVFTSCEMGYCSKLTPTIDQKLFSFSVDKYMLSHSELLSQILQKEMRGFVVISNLKINKSDRNPSFGFAIQKTKLEGGWLSIHTKSLLRRFAESKNIPEERLLKEITNRQKILGLHTFKNTVVLHTDYLVFLHTNFVLNDDFRILHFLEFCHDNILKKKVEYYINRRFQIKNQIKDLEKKDPSHPNLSYLKAFSSVLKLYNNSLYGFTLLRSDNYKSTKYIISHRIDFINHDNIAKAKLIKRLSMKTFLVSIETRSKTESTQAHVGSTIMFRSKITFLDALFFLLQNSNPKYLEILYTDTDSVHFATVFENLDKNMLESLRSSYQLNKSHFFFSEANPQMCGVLDLEAVCETHRYITEKIYQKIDQGKYITAAKGFNKHNKKVYLENTRENNIFDNPTNSFNVTSNLILSDASDNIVTKTITREFTSGLIPTKRHFDITGHSTVFSID